MRIIAGSKRRMLLETPEGLSTRPTQDRIKETLFNIIGPDIYDSYFLDLFAGSGQMGLEAVSRGAKEAIFVEQDKKAFEVIQRNLKKTDFGDQTKAYMDDVFHKLKTLNNHEPFDYIFMDPPYNNLIEKEVLKVLSNMPYVSNNTTIIVEASLETDFSYTRDLGFNIIKEKNYKTNKHIFIEKA